MNSGENENDQMQ